MLNIQKKNFNLLIDLRFLPERNQIKKFNKLVYNIYEKSTQSNSI